MQNLHHILLTKPHTPKESMSNHQVFYNHLTKLISVDYHPHKIIIDGFGMYKWKDRTVLQKNSIYKKMPSWRAQTVRIHWHPFISHLNIWSHHVLNMISQSIQLSIYECFIK